MIKIDLHSHSIGSKDGSITMKQFKNILEKGVLDYIAITDHDTIDFALTAHSEIGDQIIVGQEITTSEGELIGLYLTSKVKLGMTAEKTAEAIHKQGGLVYVPHPFETVRKGITQNILQSIEKMVDIVEAHNGRAVFQNKGPQVAAWAKLHQKPIVASSDAHGVRGLGTTFTILAKKPTKDNLVQQLTSCRFNTDRPPLSSLLYPKLNRFRATVKRSHG